VEERRSRGEEGEERIEGKWREEREGRNEEGRIVGRLCHGFGTVFRGMLDALIYPSGVGQMRTISM